MTNPDYLKEKIRLDDLLGERRSQLSAYSIYEDKPIQRKQEDQMARAPFFIIPPEDYVVWCADHKGRPLGDGQSWRDFTGQSPEQSESDGWIKVIHLTTGNGRWLSGVKRWASNLYQASISPRRDGSTGRHRRVSGVTIRRSHWSKCPYIPKAKFVA